MERYVSKVSTWTKRFSSILYVSILIAIKILRIDAIPHPCLASKVIKEEERQYDLRKLECRFVRVLPNLIERDAPNSKPPSPPLYIIDTLVAVAAVLEGEA